MLELLPLSGRYLSAKRKQITRVNYFASKINKYEKTIPAKAKKYANQLSNYHQKIMSTAQTYPEVTAWFARHPLHRIHSKIDKRINKANAIAGLASQAKLSQIYEQYTDKDSFLNLLQGHLDESYEVSLLGGYNNPVAKISNNDSSDSFIVRFLRINSQEDLSGISPRQARELLEDVGQIPRPYLLDYIEDDLQERTYLECSEYYENGSLEKLFSNLPQSDFSPSNRNQLVLTYTQQLLAFFVKINCQNVWYTDLKPSNVLLDEDGNIVISDIKGLVFSKQKKIAANKTNTTIAYYSSSVFNEYAQINLELLQRQTLANSLYQLACGKMPIQEITYQPHWKNVYDFEQEAFQNLQGQYLKDLINKLNRQKKTAMSSFLNEVKEFISHQVEPNKELVYKQIGLAGTLL